MFKDVNIHFFCKIISIYNNYLRVPRVVFSWLEELRDELVVVERDELLEEVVVELAPLEVVDLEAGEADTLRLVEVVVVVFVVAAPVERFTRLVVVVVEGLAEEVAGVRLLVEVEVEVAGVRLLVEVEVAGVRLLVEVEAAGVRLLVEVEVEAAGVRLLVEVEVAGVRLLVEVEVEAAGVRLLVVEEGVRLPDAD